MQITARFVIGAFLSIVTPALAQSQEVTLASRSFWVGDAPEIALSLDDPKWIALNRIDWVDHALANDPVLSDVIFFIRERFGSKPIDMANVHSSRVSVPDDQVPENFRMPGYSVFAVMPSLRLITFLPIAPETPHVVDCGTVTDDSSRLNACLLVVSYPPDLMVELHGRIFFPDAPANRPTFFADAARRMVEVATCLDVTGQDDPSVSPEIVAGHCKIDITS